MTFDEFQHLARLSVVGVLDAEERKRFAAARKAFGARAEACVAECRKLALLFALSLPPRAPAPETKRKLFLKIAHAPRPWLFPMPESFARWGQRAAPRLQESRFWERN